MPPITKRTGIKTDQVILKKVVINNPTKITVDIEKSHILPVKYCLVERAAQITRRIPGHHPFVQNKIPIPTRKTPLEIASAFRLDKII